jgi:hypothetical protein
MIARPQIPQVGAPVGHASGFDFACRFIQPCLCYVTIEGDFEPPVLGTGCLLSESIAITSLATVKAGSSLPGKLCLRAQGRRFDLELVFADDDLDVALVRLRTWGKQSAASNVGRYPSLGRQIPDLGLAVGMLSFAPAIDHPLRRDMLAAMFHTGCVSWWMGQPLVRAALTMGPTDVAARGGPVFLPTGELIGIVAPHPDVDHRNEGIPVTPATSLPMIAPMFEKHNEIDQILRMYG